MTGSIRLSTALGARVIRTSGQSIPNSTETALSFSRETDTRDHSTNEVDDTETSDNVWSSGEPTKLYARTAGWYMAGGSVALTTYATYWHCIFIKLSGSIKLAFQHAYDAYYSTVSVSTGMFYMHAGDYVEVYAWHNYGSSVNTAAASLADHSPCCGWLVRTA